MEPLNHPGYAIVGEEAATALRTVAQRYRQAAGAAYARSADAEAAAFRLAADRLDQVAGELPPLPKATR